MDEDDNPNVASNNQQEIPEPTEEEKQPELVVNPFIFDGPLGLLTIFDTRAGARIPEGFTESIAVFDMQHPEQILRIQNLMRTLIMPPSSPIEYVIAVNGTNLAEIYHRAPVNPQPPATV
ncbi:MAG TPA: hypothetical protein VGE63_03510 [Candidatus Paceibacterota bacterium]